MSRGASTILHKEQDAGSQDAGEPLTSPCRDTFYMNPTALISRAVVQLAAESRCNCVLHIAISSRRLPLETLVNPANPGCEVRAPALAFSLKRSEDGTVCM